jgi:hypothetical protein
MEPPVIGQTTGDSTGAARQLQTDLQELIRAAHRANVNVYGLDPGGLRTPAAPGRSVNVDTGTVTIVPSEVGAGTLNREFLRGLAGNTGGFVVTNSNDPDPDLAQIVRENGSYYCSASSQSRAASRFRRIEVRAGRRVTVRTRSGHEPAGDPPGGPAAGALAGRGIVPPKADCPCRSRPRFSGPAPRRGSRHRPRITPARRATAHHRRRALVGAYDPGGERRGNERLEGVVLRPAPGQKRP